MIGLFLKLEQGNLYNELNLNLYPYSPDNTTSVRRTVDAFVCPSNRRQTQQNPITVQTQAGTHALGAVRAVGLSGQHGGGIYAARPDQRLLHRNDGDHASDQRQHRLRLSGL